MGNTSTPSPATILWERFIEVYGTDGTGREEFIRQVQPQLLLTLGRAAEAARKQYLAKQEKVLGEDAQKISERIGLAFRRSIVGGYCLWYAKNGASEIQNSPGEQNLAAIIDHWQVLIADEKFVSTLPTEVTKCLDSLLRYEADFLSGDVPEIFGDKKEESRLWQAMAYLLVCGYACGEAQKQGASIKAVVPSVTYSR